MNDFFRKFSRLISEAAGTPWAFITALFLLLLWGLSGPIFHFSDTWQLVINTATTIITFLMVLLIQNMQNWDAKALHLKLDELIRTVQGTRKTMVALEDLSDEDLERLQAQFKNMGENSSLLSDTLEDVAEVIKEVKGNNK